MTETIFALTTDDVKLVAQHMGIDPNKLTWEHYRLIKKGMESGLENWGQIMEYAIQMAVQEKPIQQGNPGSSQWSGEVNISVRATTKEGAEETLREMFKRKYPQTEIKILRTTLISTDSIGYGHFSITYRTRQR